MNNPFEIAKRAQARTVSGAFGQFLDKEINIAKGTRSLASTSQNHLRAFLAMEGRRDGTFPRVLSIADSNFLGGSFSRHTKIWPLDDIDVYLPLDGHGLFYLQNGLYIPYTVISDGVLNSNPLLTYRWMSGFYISSSKLVSEFASVLRRHYPKETDVLSSGESVSVRMSQGSTQSGDGLGYDVVPCFKLKSHNTNELDFYLIPDGSDGWLRTNPRIDAAITNILHTNNDKLYRKIVKLIKYWNSACLNGILGSYYIELAIARALIAKNTRGEYVRSISYGLAFGFDAVSHAVRLGNQTPWIAQAPPVKPGNLELMHHVLLNSTAQKAWTAWLHELAGRNCDAIQIWKGIFGHSFPAP